MTAAFLQLTLDAPPFRPSAYGLLQTVTVREDGALQPMAGATFPSAAAGAATGNVINRTDCTPPMGGMGTKAENFSETWLNAIPLVAYGWWACAPASYTLAEAQDRARTLYLAGESRALEGLLWAYWVSLGACTAATTLTNALARAEKAIAASYGGEGVIHVSRFVATMLMAEGGSVSRVGSTLRTTASYTPVVVGDGYPADNIVFATGAISVVRGPMEDLTPTPGASINRAINDMTGIVERSYLVAVDNPIACFTSP